MPYKPAVASASSRFVGSTSARSVSSAAGESTSSASRRVVPNRRRPLQLQLTAPPDPAHLLLARRRGAVAAPGRAAPGITTSDRGAEERPVEGVLVELEPAAQRPAGPAAPRAPLPSLLDA